MIRAGITGNIGSGKSFVCNIFKNNGIPVFYSDEETKLLYLVPKIRDIIIEHFGEETYFEDGSLNKKIMSYLLFKNKDALKFIEDLLYPALNQRFDEWCNAQNAKLVLFESAILFEKHYDSFFDTVIFISANEQTRIKRVMKRDNCSEDQVRTRMALQQDETLKIMKSDYVIYNNEDIDITGKVKEIIRNIITDFHLQ